MIRGLHLSPKLRFHIGLLVMSTSAVLGRYILTDSTLVTCSRALLGSLVLMIICTIYSKSLMIDWKVDGLTLVGCGSLMTVHWVTYFYSLDYSTVALALTIFYTFPAMTAIIEPLWYRERIEITSVGLGVLACIAVAIAAPTGGYTGHLGKALIFGLVSAITYAIRNVWVRKLVAKYDGSVIMLYHLLIMGFILLPSFWLVDLDIKEIEWGPILFLGLVTTAVGHTLFLKGLEYSKAAVAGLLSTIIPISGVLRGVLFLDEVPGWGTIIGGSLLLAIVIAQTLRATWK